MENRETINEIILRLASGADLTPDQLSRDILTLSANIYQIRNRITEAEQGYAKKWEAERSKHQSDKACEMALRATEEWKTLESAKSGYQTTKEIIMAVKKRLTWLSDEMRMM